MSFAHKVSTAPCAAARPTRLAIVANPSRGSGIVCRAVNTEAVSRRELLAASLVTVSVLAQAPIALASTPEEQAAALQDLYTERTTGIIAQVRETLAVDRSEPKKDKLVKELRTAINGYIGDWRSKPKFAGKQSFSRAYIALDAVSGHYNSFGPNAPVPKSRLELIETELVKAEGFLAKNR